jgi:hypothetical protein
MTMVEPWFNPNLYAWIPGTLYGCTCGVLGGMAGWLAPRGKARGLVLGAWWLMLAVAVAFLAAGLVAFFSGQPYGVWYGLALPGVIGLIVLGGNLPTIRRAYRAAEMRRIESKDMSLS